MLTLTRVYLRSVRAPTSSRELDELAESFFGVANLAAKERIDVPEVGVVVRVREGSMEVVLIVTTIAAALVQTIAAYPKLKKGLEELIQDARATGKWAQEAVLERLGRKRIEEKRVTTGHLTQLVKITREVEEGAASPDEGFEEAQRLFERARETLPPELSRKLRASFKTVDVHPQRGPRERPSRVSRRPRRTRRYRRGIEIERAPGSRQVRRRSLSPQF